MIRKVRELKVQKLCDNACVLFRWWLNRSLWVFCPVKQACTISHVSGTKCVCDCVLSVGVQKLVVASL